MPLTNKNKLERLDNLTFLIHEFLTKPKPVAQEPTTLENFSKLSREIDRFYGLNGNISKEEEKGD